MDLLRVWRTFVWLLTVCVLLRLSVQALRVEVKPRRALFRLGERRHLRCSVQDCPARPILTWALLEDKPLTGSVNTNAAESVMTFDPVTIDHQATLLCKVSCGHESKHASASVQVYSFPEAPVIRGQDRLRLGEEATLTCEVSDLYPAELLTIDWMRGDTVLQTSVGPSGSSPWSGSVQTRYVFTPDAEDTGENVTCRATLDLQGLAAEDRTKETSVPLSPRYPPVVTVTPDSVSVMSGSSLTLSCSAEGNPKAQISWSFRPAGGISTPLSRSSPLHVRPATLTHAGRYDCVAANSEGNHTAYVEVRVHAPPTNTSITVSPGREVLEGEEVLVSCHSEGAPTPTLLLRRVIQEGAELLTSNSSPSSVSFNLSSALMDDSGLYQCEASNLYGSQLVNASISVRALQVEVTPPAAAAERGSGLVLTCRASGCLHTVLTWRSPQNRPALLRTEQQDSMSLLYLEDLDLEDEGRYSCVAQCGSVTKTKDTQVHVYSFPFDPVLEDPGPVLLDGTVFLRCAVRNVYPAALLRVQLLARNQTLLSDGGWTSNSLHNASVLLEYGVELRNQDLDLTCNADLLTNDGAVWRRRNTSISLQVHYAPMETSITVSPGREVLEGEEVLVSCHSEGDPTPTLLLRRVSQEGAELLTSNSSPSSVSFNLSSAQVDDSGLYQCEASNLYGSQLVNASISVRGKSSSLPPNLSIIIIPVVCVATGLAGVALLLDYLRRSRKKGFYHLTRSAPPSA